MIFLEREKNKELTSPRVLLWLTLCPHGDVIRGSRRWLIIAGQENKAFAAQGKICILLRVDRVTWKTPSSRAFVPLQEPVGVLASYVPHAQMQV